MPKHVSVYVVKELPALGYLYNNVCNDVTCMVTHSGPLVTQLNDENNRCALV